MAGRGAAAPPGGAATAAAAAAVRESSPRRRQRRRLLLPPRAAPPPPPPRTGRRLPRSTPGTGAGFAAFRGGPAATPGPASGPRPRPAPPPQAGTATLGRGLYCLVICSSFSHPAREASFVSRHVCFLWRIFGASLYVGLTEPFHWHPSDTRKLQ
ncbi:uncharacterized protein GJ701_001974 isoform 1-T1 [Geothlypis trichas]